MRNLHNFLSTLCLALFSSSFCMHDTTMRSMIQNELKELKTLDVSLQLSEEDYAGIAQEYARWNHIFTEKGVSLFSRNNRFRCASDLKKHNEMTMHQKKALENSQHASRLLLKHEYEKGASNKELWPVFTQPLLTQSTIRETEWLDSSMKAPKESAMTSHTMGLCTGITLFWFFLADEPLFPRLWSRGKAFYAALFEKKKLKKMCSERKS